MDLRLADNIRTFRKERKLTQEQFAEIFDITPGAVYKWEAGLSVPELNLIVEMADFFDTSVDVLLGYQMKDNNIKAVSRRLMDLYNERSEDVLIEAEKALKKYPNSFEIVNRAAMVYRLSGLGKHDRNLLKRSIALSEQSLLLVSQNTDERSGELSIYGDMAQAYIFLGEHDKGIELLKKHNIMGVFSSEIGNGLIGAGRIKEAEPYFTESLLEGFSLMTNSVLGLADVLCTEKKYTDARGLVQLEMELIRGMKKAEKPDFFSKLSAELQIIVAFTYIKENDAATAERIAREAYETARRFDASPDYNIPDINFINTSDNGITTDGLGESAAAGIRTILGFMKDDEMNRLWKEISENE